MNIPSIKTPFLAILLTLGATAGHAGAQIVITPQALPSIDPTLQSQIVIQQSDTSGGNIQVRYQSSSNIRAASQSFTWNSTEGLSGVGLNLYSNQAVTTAQTYQLVILQTDGQAANSNVTGTVQTYQFTLDSSSVVANDYLYLSLPSALALTNGGTYEFFLAPVASNASNILYLERSVASSAYPGGVAAQLSSNTVPTKVSSSGWDYGFFLTAAAVPEPSPLAMVIVGVTFSVFRRRRLISSCCR